MEIVLVVKRSRGLLYLRYVRVTLTRGLSTRVCISVCDIQYTAPQGGRKQNNSSKVVRRYDMSSTSLTRSDVNQQLTKPRAEL